MTLIGQYRQLKLDQAEIAALDTIEGTITRNSNALQIAISTAGEGSKSQAINSAIKINDSPALEAFDVLKKASNAQLKSSNDLIKKDFDTVHTITVTQTTATIVMSVLLASLLLLSP